ncbi:MULTISPECIES: DUF5994 family protein [unclassified Amycolatopsis]|uniref:DUF5994 family protein n=1 Tax=unclassified Amycolatopsis TaxID=2618356 RepID=UPI001C6A8B55|nr:DUF5994 family protein [Amycolatopsis sp. DSM 110486]QYN21963.1 hypothetical protein K1T34_05475 [Amycolatopsis sp. DSM 110486]
MKFVPGNGASATVINSFAIGHRLQLKEPGATKGCFDGAWWPRSRDPVTEFSALVASLTAEFGSVDRIGFNPAAWDLAPDRLAHGPDLVRLASFSGLQQHTIVVIGPRIHHLTLLVIPPEADPVAAERALSVTSAPDTTDSAQLILTASGVTGPA